MAFYDIYFQKNHPSWLQKIFIRYNKNILGHLLSYFPDGKAISLLEIGPGKGYFFKAIKGSGKRIDYFAVDSNKLMLGNLGTKQVYQAEAPNLPKFNQQFHIIYAAYVIEHLRGGFALYEFIKNCKKNLKRGGIMVFLAPNMLTQKMEFWNGDYTHNCPITKRNVAMVFYDNNISDFQIYDYTDIVLWLTDRAHYWRWLSLIIKILLFLYNYRFFQIIFSPIYKKKEYELDNLFYKLFYFTQADHLMFIAKNTHG